MHKKIHKTVAMLVAVFALLSLQFLLLVLDSPAADYPHNTNSQEQIQCTRCHNSGQASAHPDWWTNQEAWVCGQCHNVQAEPGQDVMTHKSGSVVRAQCTVCHNPHNQMQNRTYGTTDPTVYLYTGVSDAVGGVTATQVKKTGAGWGLGADGEGEWKGMLIIPNIRYQKFIYKIKKNTADTITIDTIGGAPDNNINTYYCKGGNTFAIVWGKLVRENVNRMNVKFFRETGRNSFADDDATIDGICQVCHTQTKYFRKDGFLTNSNHPASAGANCTQCHKHDVGFKATCTTCHGNPPIAATAGGPNGLASNESGSVTNSTTAGAHTKHATGSPNLNYSCSTCHLNSDGSGATHNNGFTVTMGFSIFSHPGGTYNGQSGVVYNSSDSANTFVTNNNTLTCSVYCHSSVQPDGGGAGAPVYSAPVWSGIGTVVCGSCHKTTASSPLGAIDTGSHTKHLGSPSITCESCHTGAGDGTSYSAATHVNYNIDVTAALNYSLGGAPGNGYGGCSTSACHSNGKGSYASPTWGGSSPGCTFCHPALSGKHSSHVIFTNSSIYGSTAANVSGSATNYDFGCGNCHPTAIASHMNGVVNISLDPGEGGTLKSKNSGTAGIKSGSGTTIVCAGVYCHSDGRSTPIYADTPQWGNSFTDASNTCGQCHGNSPTSGAHQLHAVGIHFEDVYNGTSGKTAATGGAGSGAAHGDPGVSTTISCNICHAATLSKSRNKFGSACNGCHNGDAASTAVVSADLTKTTHVNGTPNISFAAIQIKSRPQVRDNITTVATLNAYWQRMNSYKAGATSYDQSKGTLAATAGYNGAGTCSAVACHNGISIMWTSTLSCDGCHTELPQ